MEDGLLNMMRKKQHRADEMTTTGRELGFTVVELVVVLAILVLLAAITVPAATVWLPNYYLRNAAMDIFSNIQYAKTEAVRLDSPYAVVFDPGNDRFSLASGPGADGVFGTGNDDDVVRTINLSGFGKNIVFGKGNATVNFDDGGGAFPADSVSFTNNAVVFDSRGMCNSGSVYLQNPNRAYAVGTLMSGVLRISSWGSGAWQ
ncbi:MAG: GspH/FimT family protein [Syntrophobacterales bacterium]|jgi:Tfp pilus assembly protein FimT